MKEPVEPTVLDYVKSKIKYGLKGGIEFPQTAEEEQVEVIAEPKPRAPLPLVSLIALLLALFAQRSLEPVPGIERRAGLRCGNRAVGVRTRHGRPDG